MLTSNERIIQHGWLLLWILSLAPFRLSNGLCYVSYRFSRTKQNELQNLLVGNVSKIISNYSYKMRLTRIWMHDNVPVLSYRTLKFKTIVCFVCEFGTFQRAICIHILKHKNIKLATTARLQKVHSSLKSQNQPHVNVFRAAFFGAPQSTNITSLASRFE